jgi:hypothetical protein
MRSAPLVLALAAALSACGHGQKSGQQAGQQQVAGGPVLQGNEEGVTPMPQRVAVLGLLNKRNGLVREVALRPGQTARWNDLIVHLRACEATAPWEDEKLTGAFVQVDVEGTDKRWRRVFSGWLYKESPSLNVVEHPVYDVWPKSCAMNFPAGPPAPAAPAASSNLSISKKSGGGTSDPDAEEAPAEPSPTASDNNET